MMLFDEYHWSVKYIVVQWLLSILLVEWAIQRLNRLRIYTEEDQKMAQKYPEFKRNDLDTISRVYCYL